MSRARLYRCQPASKTRQPAFYSISNRYKSTSFHSLEKYAPPNAGTKDLVDTGQGGGNRGWGGGVVVGRKRKLFEQF
jgi:hypothetical protein